MCACVSYAIACRTPFHLPICSCVADLSCHVIYAIVFVGHLPCFSLCFAVFPLCFLLFPLFFCHSVNQSPKTPLVVKPYIFLYLYLTSLAPSCIKKLSCKLISFYVFLSTLKHFILVNLSLLIACLFLSLDACLVSCSWTQVIAQPYPFSALQACLRCSIKLHVLKHFYLFYEPLYNYIVFVYCSLVLVARFDIWSTTMTAPVHLLNSIL